MKHIGYLALFCALLWSGCDKPEALPAYLDIKPFAVNANGGAAWQKITEGWVYVNGNLLGAYTLPASVPILEEGDVEVQVFAGIKENGIVATPALYNVLSPYKTTVRLTPTQNTTIQPVAQYNPLVTFAWPEDETTFDGTSSISLEARDTDTLTTFELTTVGAFDGKSVLLRVDTAHTLIEIAAGALTLPQEAERQKWLELHYFGDIPFRLYLLGVTNGSEVALNQVFEFNETAEAWKKIYINLTGFIGGNNAPKTYRLVFRVQLPQETDGSYKKINGKVLLDNIRMIHF
jgi:hypothetical protein